MIEKILERLEELKNYDCGGMKCKGCKYADLCYAEGENVIKVAIDKCKEIVQEVAKDGGWIPCSERLPKEATTYQVTEEVVINSRKQYVVDMRLFGTEGEWLCPSNRKVIAWQPLPAVYKPKED